MPTHTTYCRICEAACGLLVDQDSQGRLTALRPDPDHPTSAGYACKKGVRFLDVASHPTRLLRPRRRGGGDAGWDEALDDVARRLQAVIDAHGPDAVALYTGNPLAFSFLGTLASQQLAQALGTRNVYSAGSQDANNKFAAGQLMHGSPLLAPVPDLEHADLAIMLGTNPAVSLSSFVHLPGGTRVIDALIARGGHVVWVDPRRTESARRWGEHLPIRPGTDVVLLLALIDRFRGARQADGAVEGLEPLLTLAARYPLERAAAVTGIPEEDIVALGDRIAASPSTTFHLSTGVNMGGFGTLAVVALQGLAWLTGNLDRRGGLVFAPLAAPFARLARALGVGKARRGSRIGGFAPTIDTLPGAVLADEILTPGPGQIRALVVMAGDPLRSIPGEARLREALGSLDLLVTIDLFENATGRLAHWCLPTTSWLERWDVATTTIPLQTSSLVQVAGPVTSPPGDTRTEPWIIGGLLQRLGHRVAGAGLRLPLDRWLPARGYGLRLGRVKPGSYLGRGPMTPGHRVRFWDPLLDAEARRLEEQVTTEGGFLLIGRRQKLAHNSWLHGGERATPAAPVAFLAAEDLRRLGVPPGGRIELTTAAGSAVIDAAAEEGMRPGVVCIPHGLDALNVNALIPSGVAAVEPASGQHHMTGVPVQIRAAG